MKSALTLFLIAALAVLPMGCGMPKARSSDMTAEQTEKLRAALEKLDAVLNQKAAFISNKFTASASGEDITALRKGLGGVEVQCLEIWYKWHNGCARPTNILPLGRMLSIRESLDDREMDQRTPFVDSKRRTAIKILDDGAGDGFFLDLSSPNPRVFYHMLEDPFPRDYGTLEGFVGFITQVHSSGVASAAQNGLVSFDLEKYDKIESDYLSKLTRP